MMRRAKNLLAFLIAAACLTACRSPFQPGAAPKSSSKLILSIAGDGTAKKAARTIVPDVSNLIAKYSVLLQKGTASQTVTGTTSPIDVDGLEAGIWTVTVSGLDASDNLLAQTQGGATANVSADHPASVSVTLIFIQDAGSGGIDITLAYPPSIGIDGVDATLGGSALSPAPAIDASDPAATKVRISQAKVAAGSPILHVFLKKGGTVLAGVTESLWVFQNVTTKATIRLNASDFGSPPEAPTGFAVSGQHDGTLLLAWSDVSDIADAYVVRRSGAAAGPFVQVGSDLAFDAASFTDSGLTAGTPYYYQVTAKNRFGESQPANGNAATFTAAAAPTFSPAPGPTFLESQVVSLSSATAGASLYYTIDGSVPSASSIPYAASIPLAGLGSNLSIKAIAVMAGMADSAVSAATYAIDQAPIISGFSASPAIAYRRTPVALAISARDPEAGALTYQAAFTAGAGSVSGTAPNLTASVTAVGKNTLVLTVKDTAGNQSTASLDIIGVNQAPIFGSIRASATPLYIQYDGANNIQFDTKTFEFQATDPDGDTPLAYNFSLGSGFGSVTGSGSTATFTTGNNAGIGTVHATVSDSLGVSTAMDLQVKVVGWNQLADHYASRYGHTAIYDGAGNMIVFGGYVAGGPTNDVWKFDIAGNAWSNIGPSSGPAPSPRAYHSAIFHDGKMTIFGGQDGVSGFKDVWEFDLTNRTWAQLASSPFYGLPTEIGVYNHSAIYDGNGSMIVFGGVVYGSSAANNKLWKYSFASGGWVQLSPTGGPPAARLAHSAVNRDGGNMLVFGGKNGTGATPTYYNDVWNYNLSTNAWTQYTSASGPAARNAHSAIYDGKGNMVIFGGIAAGYFKDTWEYNIPTQTWTALPSGIASGFVYPRLSHSAIYDGKGNMIMFGGVNSGIGRFETWMLVLP